MNFKTFLKFYFFLISLSFITNQSCPMIPSWLAYKSYYNIIFYSLADETTSYVFIETINNSIFITYVLFII